MYENDDGCLSPNGFNQSFRLGYFFEEEKETANCLFRSLHKQIDAVSTHSNKLVYLSDARRFFFYFYRRCCSCPRLLVLSYRKSLREPSANSLSLFGVVSCPVPLVKGCRRRCASVLVFISFPFVAPYPLRFLSGWKIMSSRVVVGGRVISLLFFQFIWRQSEIGLCECLRCSCLLLSATGLVSR